MSITDLLVVSGAEIRLLLAEERKAVLDTVRRAYLAYGQGLASPPDSTFLRFPGRDRERIIALPAYLGGEWELASLKWIASFPDNTRRGLDRASATLVINDLETGYPAALLESSTISAWRTAASAALAAQHIHPATDTPLRVGVIGCGLISYETLMFLRAALNTPIQQVQTADLSAAAAEHFIARSQTEAPEIETWTVSPAVDTLLATTDIVIFGTTAIRPHITAIPDADHPRTLLHLSLRDLAPETLLAADNTADDVHHVNRSQTSVHLLSQQRGNADFMRASLAQLLSGELPPRDEEKPLRMFHPFGLGMLDLAVGAFVLQQAREKNVGTVIPDFIPAPWRQVKTTPDA